MSFEKVPFGNAEIFNVIVEVPAGGQKKYEYDKEIGAMKLDKVLYGDLKFPFNYGHVPKTWAGDNELLDVFVFSTYPLNTGTVVACRAVGVLELIDRKFRDYKILAIPVSDSAFEKIKDIVDVPKEDIKKITDFYGRIKQEVNKDIELGGFKNRQEAIKELLRAQEPE